MDPTEFPAEFAADPARDTEALGWTVGVLAPAALVLALLNAEAIAGWTHELPAHPVTARVMNGAENWLAATAKVGFDVPRKRLHGAWKRAEAMRWRQADAPEPA